MFTINKIIIDSKDDIKVTDILANETFLQNISKDTFLYFILSLRETNKYINIHNSLYNSSGEYTLYLHLEKTPKIIINDVKTE